MALPGIPAYGRMTATPIRANDVAQPIEVLNSPRLSLMLHFTQSPADRRLRQPQVQLPAALAIAALVEMEFAPWEFAFVEVSLTGTPSKELAEEETAGALNDHLSYRQAPAE